MRLTAALCLLSMLGATRCVTAPPMEYRAPIPTDVVANCNPDYPCANSYYWDEYREVYVYYDGYRYIDCTGMPGGYPLPPQGIVYLAVPPGYVPPSAWVPPRGSYRAPVGFIARGGPAPPLPPPPPPQQQGYYGAPPPRAAAYGSFQSPGVQIPYGSPSTGPYQSAPLPNGRVGPQNPNRYGEPNRAYEALPPAPPVARGEALDPARDPRPSAYGAPPPSGGTVPGRYPASAEPVRGGYGAPPPPAAGGSTYPIDRPPEGRGFNEPMRPSEPQRASPTYGEPSHTPTYAEPNREPARERAEAPAPQLEPQPAPNAKKTPVPPAPAHAPGAPVHPAPPPPAAH